MPTIYHKTFRVPIWLIVDVDAEFAEPLVQDLLGRGAFEQEWPGHTFGETVKELGGRGWTHVVNQAYPFTPSVEFLQVAMAALIKKVMGAGKMLGAPTKPWGQALNRKVDGPEAWERIFNRILELEDSRSLSQLFDIGDKCYNETKKYALFVTRGAVPRNPLQDITENVIFVGRDQGDVTQAGNTVEEFVNKTLDHLDQTFENFKKTVRS